MQMMLMGSTQEAFARARLEHELARACGLREDGSVSSCGQTWCTLYDDEQHTCALLRFNMIARMGVPDIEWFAAHRRREA